jgi:hypothetical protein
LTADVSGTLPMANGGTGVAVASDDTVLVGSGSAWVAQTLPNCTDTVGQHLNYTQSSNAFSCGTSMAANGLVPGGRLTLASGYPVYFPNPSTPASTDTGAETVTFSVDPAWVTGTVLTPVATGGGLTTGTRYFTRRLSSTTYAFYTTLADAEADTNRVNLTANVTNQLTIIGVSGTTLYYAPYLHAYIPLWDGSVWVSKLFSQISLVGPTINQNNAYDVFVYLSSGTPTLELLAWTNINTRATAIVQDATYGYWIKSGDTTRLYVGSLAGNTADPNVLEYTWLTQMGWTTSSKALIQNFYHQIPRTLRVESNASHTYNSATIRAWNNDAQMRAYSLHAPPWVTDGSVSLTVGTPVPHAVRATTVNSSTGGIGVGWGINTTTGFTDNAYTLTTTNTGSQRLGYANFQRLFGVFYSSLNENSNASATNTFSSGELTVIHAH